MREFRLRTAFLLLLAGCLCGLPAAALGAEAEGGAHADGSGLMEGVGLSTTAERGRLERLTDGNHGTHLILPKGSGVTARWEADAGVRYVFLDWGALGDGFTVTQQALSGETVSVYPGDNRERRCLIPVAETAASLTVTVNAPSRLAELRALGEADALPEEVRPWQPPLPKADMLVISAHPDDEIVMFGGLLPTYAGERGYAVQVLYMTMQNKIRYREAREGLWAMGLRNAPVIGPFADEEGQSADRYRRIWGGEDRIVGYLTEQLRRFRPLVVVTHDLGGEYGHGAHMVTAACVQEAVGAAADPARYPESAGQYGLWQVQKLYLHLYPENVAVLDYGQPLSAFGGKTALEAAEAAYGCHASQRGSWLKHLLRGTYDSTRYGLAESAVGTGETGTDLFENIDPATLTGASEKSRTEIP